MSLLRIGVIGLGVGERHIPAYQQHSNCRVTAICDFSKERLDDVAGRFAIPRQTTDAGEILTDPDIDLVSIATFDNYHHEQVTAALEHGKHVFVEKPLCLRRDELADIEQKLRERPQLKLSSNLILRKSPRFLELRRMIADGELGELFHVEGDYCFGRLHKITAGWRHDVDDYSVVHGGAIHMIDLLMWLAEEPIVEVAAYGNAIASRGSGFRYNDMVVAIVRFDSGVVGKISANFGCVRPHFHGLAVYGTKATFINGLEHASLFRSREPHAKPEHVTSEYPGTQKGDLIAGFVDSIVRGVPAEVSAEDVLRAMAVSLAIEESVRSGGPVAVGDMRLPAPEPK